MDYTGEVLVLLTTVVYLITTIIMWRKKFIRYLLLFIIIIVLLKLIDNYFDNTFIVKYRPIFKLDSSSDNFNYENDFINNKKLSNDQIVKVMQETLGEFNYPVIKLSFGSDGLQHGPFIVKYPKYFMSDEQKISCIIDQFIQERMPYVKFKSINFSFKTGIGYFLYISIEIPHGEIPEKYFKVKNKVLQMFISLDDKFIVWNNWINRPRD